MLFCDWTKLYYYAFHVKFTLGPPITLTQCLLRRERGFIQIKLLSPNFMRAESTLKV